MIEGLDMAQMPLESVSRTRDGGVSVAQLDGLGSGPSIGTADGQRTQSTPLDAAHQADCQAKRSQARAEIKAGADADDRSRGKALAEFRQPA